VRKRIAVPAGPISMWEGRRRKASLSTRVSSQSDRLNGVGAPGVSAWMMRARLLILFEAGKLTSAWRTWGGSMM